MKRYVFALSAALAACGSDTTSTNVPAALNVAFSVTQTSAGHTVVSNGVSSYVCVFAFSAHATGGMPGDYSLWTDGEIDFRLSANGAASSLFLDGTTLQDWFGSDQLNAGATETATRSLQWSGPFTATVLFRYLDGSLSGSLASHTATLNVNC